METQIEETGEQAIQAAIVQAKLYEESQISKQKDLDNYFAAVRIKAQINAGGSKNSGAQSRLSNQSGSVKR